MDTVEEVVRSIISKEIKDCDDILETDNGPHIRDFVRGFKLGLKRTKRHSLGHTALLKLYGNFRLEEDRAYRKRRVNAEKVRTIQGKVHAIASVMTLVQDALNSLQAEEPKNSILQALLSGNVIFMKKE